MNAFAIVVTDALCGGINSPGKAIVQSVVADASMMKHTRSTAAARASYITNGRGCKTAVIMQMQGSSRTMAGAVFVFATNGGTIMQPSVIGHLQMDIKRACLLIASM